MTRLSLRRFACALIAVFALLRLAQWNASLTGDEGYMLRYYVGRGPAYIATHYEAPNNHILLSLILNRVNAWSPKELIVSLANIFPLRVPCLLAAAATLPLLYFAAGMLLPPGAAVLAVTVLGVSFWHLIYSTMLRGYGMSAFFNLLNVALVPYYLRRRRAWALALFSLSIACSHYLIPSNLMFTAALTAWLAYRLQRARSAGAKDEFRALLRVCAALAAGLVLTALLYAPVARQLLRLPSLGSGDNRLAEELGVLGVNIYYRAAMVLFSAAGLAMLFRRGSKYRSTSVLLSCYAVVPFLVLTFQKSTAPSRVFVAALPMWSLMIAAGLQGLWSRFAVRGSRSALRLRLGTAALCLALVVASAGEIRAYLDWHRGVDYRKAMETVMSLTRDEDDFVMIFTPEGSAAGTVDALNWDYYAERTGVYRQVRYGGDAPSMLRRRYFVLARDEAALAAALDQSRIDPFLRASTKIAAEIGSLHLYTLTMDESVKRRYEEALASPRSTTAEKTQALTGLGYAALSEGKLAEAVKLLGKAKSLAPGDVRVRNLLGYGKYLSFDDAGAGEALAGVAEDDPSNPYPRLFAADAFLWRGRTDDAMRGYIWYNGPEKTPQAWMVSDRAGEAFKAVQSGKAKLIYYPKDARKFEELSGACRFLGEYERAEAAMGAAVALEPTPARLVEQANLNGMVGRHARAAELLRRAIAAGGDDTARLRLVDALAIKLEIDDALRLFKPLLAAYPADPHVLEMNRRLTRL